MRSIVFIATVVLCFTTNNLFAQGKSSKINVYLTYNHAFGIKETNILWDLHGNKSNLYTNSFHVKGMYHINELFSLGVGLGADALWNPRYTSFPMYASVHFSPIYQHPNWFLYTNLGYALNTKISYPGLHSEIGIGRQWFLRKHFGISLNAGYNLKQMRNIGIQVGNKTDFLYTTRHSLSVGFGLIF